MELTYYRHCPQADRKAFRSFLVCRSVLPRDSGLLFAGVNWRSVDPQWLTKRLYKRDDLNAPKRVLSILPKRDAQLTSVMPVRRDKAALSSGCKSHPANAPAGSNRSSHGGNEVAEAFG